MITKSKKVGFNYFLLLALPFMLAQCLLFLKPIAYPKAIEGTIESEYEAPQSKEEEEAYIEEEGMTLWEAINYIGKEEENINDLFEEFHQSEPFFLSGFWGIIGLLLFVVGAIVGVFYVLLIPAGRKLQGQLAKIARASSIFMLLGELGIFFESFKLKNALMRVKNGQEENLGFSYLLEFKPLGFTTLYIVLVVLLVVNILFVASFIGNYTYKLKEYVPKTAEDGLLPKININGGAISEASEFMRTSKKIEDSLSYDECK